MDKEQKKRVMKRFITEKSVNPEQVNLDDEALASYSALDALLDYIVAQNQGLFVWNTVEENKKQWRQLSDIINYATTFIQGSPPTLTHTDEKKAAIGLRYWKNVQLIKKLPQNNYYQHPVYTPLIPDLGFLQLLANSKAKLYALSQDFPGAIGFNPSDSEQIQRRINSVIDHMKTLDETQSKITFKRQINVLMDLNKLNQLHELYIPQDKGDPLAYCTLAEPISGVTAKISLVSLSSVKEHLTLLCAQDKLTISQYLANREQYRLNTEAIIKLPKYGDIKEVQREAITLNISRMLGLDTTLSTTVSYDSHPALFIPFDTIRLLSDFASGKTFNAGLGFGSHTYTHYSTIKSVGSGIQADCYIDDFGYSFALFYLCNDPDAIGGYCQNKALKDGKSLFIFDQVVMDSDKFALDSRLSLQPDQFLIKHLRHGQGRNRTLIEDSAIEKKYASLMQLRDKKELILHYLSSIIQQHNHHINKLQKQLKKELTKEQANELTTQLSDIILLEQDAKLIKATIEARIKKIDDMLPKTTGPITSFDILQILILEKLLHNPVLFTEDARPYKNPWTYRQINTAESIVDLLDGTVQITFKSKIPAKMIQFIKRRGTCDSLIIINPKVITLSKNDLHGLKEGILHPEHYLALKMTTNYLVQEDLAQIQEAYGRGYRAEIIKTISLYQTKMNSSNQSLPEKLDTLVTTEVTLKKLIEAAPNKGFGMHVLKKFYFDAQQQLQKLMNGSDKPEHLDEAFIAALKLDRIAEFNTIVLETIRQGKLSSPQFKKFLSCCIKYEALATNHPDAKKQSFALYIEYEKVMAYLHMSSTPEAYAPALIDGLLRQKVEETFETEKTQFESSPVQIRKRLSIQDLIDDDECSLEEIILGPS